MINFFTLIMLSLFLMSCDNSSTNPGLDNGVSFSSSSSVSSSSKDSLEYVEPPKLSGWEYNPDFNAIIGYLAPPLYNDGKWVMARFNSVKIGPLNTYSDYESNFVFFVSRDDMATWEETVSLKCNRSDDIKSAFVWNGRFYYAFRDVLDSMRTFFFSSEDGVRWDSIAIVGLPANVKDDVVRKADFHVVNNKVFAVGRSPWVCKVPSYVTSDMESWQEMKLRDGGSACGNNVTWGEPGYRMADGNIIMYSDDGVIWDSTSTNSSHSYKIAYGNGVFVRAAYNGRDALQWSRDGFEWNPPNYVNSNGSVIFYDGVVFEDGIFLAYGGGMMAGTRSYLLVSVNGQDWVEQDKVAYSEIERIVYGNGRYLATISDGSYAIFQKEP